MEKDQESKPSMEDTIVLERDADDPSSGMKDGGSSKSEVVKEAPEFEYITGIKLFTVLASVTLVFFLVMLDMAIIVTAIPQMTTDFHSLSDVGWYGSAYLLASSALQPLTGKMYTHFSTKITFLVFLALFEIGSAICAAAQSSTMFIIGRAVAGLGTSGLSNGSLTIITASAPMRKRPALMGIMLSLSQLGIIGGPLIGGAFTQYVTWRWCFYINLPIGAASFILLLLINIPEPAKKNPTNKPTILATLSQLDLTGFVFFSGFAVMFLLALQWGGIDYPWKSATIIGLFCGSGVMLGIFAAWEYHVGDEAMIPYSMCKKTVVWASCLVIFFYFGSMLIFSYYLPIYFQGVKGVKPALSGVYLLPGILGQMLTAVTSGIIVGKIGYYLPFSIACSVIVPIGAGLISTFQVDTPTVKWVMYQFISGFGRGLGLQMPILAIQNVLPQEQVSVGMALVVFCQTFGGTLFLSFAQTIFSHSLREELAKFAPTVNAENVIIAGATAIRDVVRPEELLGVLRAYNKAINHNFYLAAASAAGMFLFCWGLGWKKIKKENSVKKKEEVV